ncbi:NAD(P)/FAD-dependent oxidoreductase [Tenuibacillus multivorans]|uniref:D-amino-acid dehydrogenase n=1 Tax=Tenuibacillus multivorans TaxID=237069 RepID=A0A1G9YMG7_9BACI|nr:FAD-binding oxidoreductase [Tenuibacillus multivorans]GEL78471.1 oxidoreductase [Tenuibacillus multivorans]SDN10290.1 D-amino-acid dehydrogenase [Tenuibacillus multivorans]
MKPYIVIGAGILGASTAYHLTKKGAKVLLIDKKDEGEATRVAAGIISPWLSQKKNDKLYQVIKNGARYYPGLIRQLSEDGITETSYGRVGSIHLHKNEEKLDKMVKDASHRRETAPEVGDISILTSEEVAGHVPIMADRMGAVHVSGGARVNGDTFRATLVAGAKKHGAEVLKGEAEIVDQATVRVGDQTYSGEKLIVTNGAWAERLLKQVGVEFKVKSQKTQILHLELPHQDPSKWPAIMLPNNKYIVGFSNHKVFVGSSHRDNDDFDSTSSASGVYEILKTAFKFAPGLEEAQFIESRVGFRPMTPLQYPVLGPLPGQEKIIVANGLGASGITSGPFLGAELSRFILDEDTILDFKNYNIL